jgi:hypothetical protein
MKQTQRLYYVFLLISLICLVFYGGFLYGNRERINGQDENINALNPNGQETNSISKVNLRPIQGSNNAANIQEYGRLFFLVNQQNKTEILINIENVPLTITAPSGAKIEIPSELRIDLAKRVTSQDGRDNYEYENVSTNENIVASLTLIENENGTRSGRFSGFINSSIVSSPEAATNVERIVLRPMDASIQNIFIDTDESLPLLIRGNAQAQIPGQPAPFFWIKI